MKCALHTEEPQIHYTKQKTPDTESHTHDSMYMKYSEKEKEISTDRKKIGWAKRGNGIDYKRDTRDLFGNVLRLGRAMMVAQLTKNH